MAYNFSSWYPGNTTMGMADRILYSSAFFFSIFNFVVITICLPVAFRSGKTFHINFRVLRLNIIISYYIFSIGLGLFSAACLFENDIIPEKNYLIQLIGTITLQIGHHIMRCLWLGIFIERSIATFYSQIYEQRKCLGITFFIPFVFNLLAISIVAARFIFVVHEDYLHGLRSMIDFTDVVTIFLLFAINKRRRRITQQSKILLTQRYQISENIRVFKLIAPILILGIFMTTCGTISAVTNKMSLKAHEIYRYTIIIYYQLFLLVNLICLILWLRNGGESRYRLRHFMNKVVVTRKIHEPTLSLNRVTPVLKNVDGKSIINRETIDDHFRSLAHMWK